MPPVRLHFTVDVTIEPIDRSATEWNTRAREPILQVAREVDPVVVRAQVQFTSRGDPAFTRSGIAEKTSGYLVVRVDDLEAMDYTPTRGDKITDIPGETGTYFITFIRPGAHKYGRNRILNLGFEDRAPVKES